MTRDEVNKVMEIVKNVTDTETSSHIADRIYSWIDKKIETAGLLTGTKDIGKYGVCVHCKGFMQKPIDRVIEILMGHDGFYGRCEAIDLLRQIKETP